MKNKVFKFSQIMIMICVISCILLSSVLAVNVWSRYFSQAEGDDGGRVAAWAFDVQDKNGKFELDLSAVNYPGTKKEYTFTVTNNKNGVSEVAQLVSVDVILSGELPLKITLTDADGTKFIETSEKSTHHAEIVSFAAGVVGSKDLKLTVEWPQTENDAAYASKTAKVTVSLTAEQIN